MKTKLKYGNTYLDIYTGYELTKSSQEVAYSDLECDFTGHAREELPERYQEAKIININDNGNEETIMYGYVDNYDFGEMREKDIDTIMNITLLSPMKLATLRTAIAIGTYEISDLIVNTIMLPLIDDGFVLKEIDITKRQVTVNFLVETIEYCMNNLSNKYNIWWHIDENKNIYVKDISKMVTIEAEDAKHTYDKTHNIAGLEYLKPITNSDDYANVVNFKNVRIYETSYYDEALEVSQNPLIKKPNMAVNDEEQITFNFPIDISLKNIKKSLESQGNDEGGYVLYLIGEYEDSSSFIVDIYYSATRNTIKFSDNVGIYGEDEDKEFMLVKDSFFNSLITGLIYKNKNKNIKRITTARSHCVLVWNMNKMYNNKGIEEKRGKISNTGIVETTIDMRESWKTMQELAEIGSTYLEKNSLKYADEIEIKLDRDVFSIGDTIYINRFMIDDIYVVTQIKQINANTENEYIVKCKKANMAGNYIDVFRSESEQVETEKELKLSVIHYEEEEILERYEVIM